MAKNRFTVNHLDCVILDRGWAVNFMILDNAWREKLTLERDEKVNWCIIFLDDGFQKISFLTE